MSEPNARDKEVVQGWFANKKVQTGSDIYIDVADYREEIEASIEKKIIDSEKWEWEWAENCGGMALPAPAQAREDEARYSCYITAGEYPDRISVKPPIEVFARGLVNMGDHVDLIFGAALRSRQSQQAADNTIPYGKIEADLLRLAVDCPSSVYAEAYDAIRDLRLRAAAPQPSPQGEDADKDAQEISDALLVLFKATFAEANSACGRWYRSALVALARLRARLASAHEDVARSEQHARNKFADAMSFKARAEKAEAALASAQSSAQGEEAASVLDHLRHLTPGGSEFQTADECFAWIEKRLARKPWKGEKAREMRELLRLAVADFDKNDWGTELPSESEAWVHKARAALERKEGE